MINDHVSLSVRVNNLPDLDFTANDTNFIDRRPTAVSLRMATNRYHAPMTLKSTQKRYLRSQAHHLKAFLQSGGKGITDTFLSEVDLALQLHELVKIKLAAGDRDERSAMIERIARTTGADVVQTIGHTVTLFRRNPDEPKYALPA